MAKTRKLTARKGYLFQASRICLVILLVEVCKGAGKSLITTITESFSWKKSLVTKVPACYKSAPLVTKVPYNVTKVPCCRYKSALVALEKCPWLQKFPTLVTKVPYPVTKVPFFRYKSALRSRSVVNHKTYVGHASFTEYCSQRIAVLTLKMHRISQEHQLNSLME